VLIGDITHHPFWDTLDYTKFSVQVLDHQVADLESILLSHTWEDVQRMQTNLMLIRDAFLYPAEDDGPDSMENQLKEGRRGPFWFALHGMGLLGMTRFPV
jgi:hypothetical protein